MSNIMFIGRKEELKELETIHSGKGLKGLVLFGRRRIGKTALIEEFCKDKRTIFFRAREKSEAINLHAYALAVSKISGPVSGFKNFEEAMEFTVKVCEKEKTVLVIDELPFLADAAPYFPSTLQHYMDSEFRKLDLTVIICGSSISMMSDIVSDAHRPLFGRFSRMMKLEPFDYIEACKFLPGFTDKECAEAYCITGGVPYYLELMSGGSFKDAVIRNFLSKSASLMDEPENLIRQEFKSPSRYTSILISVAKGNTQVNHISNDLGLDQPVCSKHIASMEYLDIIRKEAPVSNSKRRPVYEVSDGLFQFRYGLMEKVLELDEPDADKKYDRIMELMPDFMGKQFEGICRQYVRMNTAYRTTGKWWGSDPERRTDVEIDIIATDGTDLSANVLFGSCKYRSRPMGKQDLDELVRTSSLVTGYRSRRYALFSLSGFTDDLIEGCREDVDLVDLGDLYKGRRGLRFL